MDQYEYLHKEAIAEEIKTKSANPIPGDKSNLSTT
jgi:hypothetical protein